MINPEQYFAEIDARAMKYAGEFAFASELGVAGDYAEADFILIKRAMLDAATLVNDAWLREIGKAMAELKPDLNNRNAGLNSIPKHGAGSDSGQ